MRADSMGGVGEGLTTARISTDPDAAAYRAARAADARGNLAAIVLDRHGINPVDEIPDAVKTELRELAQALGLDGPPPTRRPGHCACGAKLPFTAVTTTTGRHPRGQCTACQRGDR